MTLGTFLRFTGIVMIIVFIVGYVHFQARNIIRGPVILLSDTYEPVQHARSVTITGKANNIVKITLNGREIYTDESGEFRQTIILENGYTIMKLAALDRFGRTTSIVREYVFVPLPA